MTVKKAPTAPAPVEGVPVVIGSTEYIVPALSLFEVRRFAPQLRKLDMSAQLDESALDLISEVGHAALKRNYPELQREDLEKDLDLRNLMPVYQAVMGVSGMVQTGEGAESGESTGRS